MVETLVKSTINILNAYEGRRCATCKHWAKGFAITPWGQCRLAESVHGMAKLGTLASAGEPYEAHAWLDTHEDFGCVQWQSTT